MMNFVIPKKSSLSSSVRRFLRLAGYPLGDGDIDGVDVKYTRFFEADRRDIPRLIARGAFDAGITGYDLYLNSGEDLRSVEKFCFSRSTLQPARWVLASRKEWAPDSKKPSVIVTELPDLAKRILSKTHITFPYIIERINGTEEKWVADGIADCVFVVTETGGSIKRHGLEILPGCEELLVSTPRIFSQKDLSSHKEVNLRNLVFALKSVVGGDQYVMITFMIREKRWPILGLPSAVTPSVKAPPKKYRGKKPMVSVEICVPHVDYSHVGRMIEIAGGKAIVMQFIQGYTP